METVTKQMTEQDDVRGYTHDPFHNPFGYGEQRSWPVQPLLEAVVRLCTPPPPGPLAPTATRLHDPDKPATHQN